MNDETDTDVRRIAGDIVAAYLSNNQLPVNEVPTFIRSVMSALDQTPSEAEPARQPPAVPVKESVRDDVIFCLECGLSQKTLKRHIRVAHELSPEDYREKWNLPGDYPLVAPSYSKARSTMAKKIGLGQKTDKAGSNSAAKK